MMKRRLITAMGLGGLLWAVRTGAQERVYRVGYLSWQDSGTYYDITLRGFLEGLRSEGFVEGKNLQLLHRSASNNADRFKPICGLPATVLLRDICWRSVPW